AAALPPGRTPETSQYGSNRSSGASTLSLARGLGFTSLAGFVRGSGVFGAAAGGASEAVALAPGAVEATVSTSAVTLGAGATVSTSSGGRAGGALAALAGSALAPGRASTHRSRAVSATPAAMAPAIMRLRR